MNTSNPANFGPNPTAVSSESSDAVLRGRPISTKPWLGLSGQWGAIAGGAFTGLAVGVAMATLGAALGLTASAVAADQASESFVGADGAQAAALGFSIGAGVWLLLTAAVVGLSGGGVLAKLAHPDRPYSPRVLGLVTWAFGMSVAVLLATSGASSVATGMGVGVAGATGAVANSPGLQRSLEGNSRTAFDSREREADAREAGSRDGEVRAGEASMARGPAAISAEERAAAIEVAENVATAASTAAWFALVAQLIGLGATLMAAGRRKFQADAGLAVVNA